MSKKERKNAKKAKKDAPSTRSMKDLNPRGDADNIKGGKGVLVSSSQTGGSGGTD